MKKVIIFGATGTVGAYTSLFLKDLGYDVIAVGRRKSDNNFFSDHQISYYSIDISDSESFEVLPHKNLEAVLYFAGAMPAKMEGYNPYEYVNTIVMGTLNVLEYAKRINCNRFVFSQSISDILYLFGSENKISADVERRFPVTGDHSVYSICKNAAVNFIEHYAVTYNFKYFILRLPTIYAYHGSPYYYVNGERKYLAYRLLIEKAMRGEPIEVWGNPAQKKEITYIKDLLQIIRGCLETTVQGGIYNVGTGVGVSLEEQIDGIIEVFSSKNNPSPKIYCPSKPSSPQFVLDITKTQTDLGYTPKYGYLEYLRDMKDEMEMNRFNKLWGDA